MPGGWGWVGGEGDLGVMEPRSAQPGRAEPAGARAQVPTAEPRSPRVPQRQTHRPVSCGPAPACRTCL